MFRSAKSPLVCLLFLALFVCLALGASGCIFNALAPAVANQSGTTNSLHDHWYKNADGTWFVYYNSPLIYREFQIDIRDSNITDAWDQNYTTIGGIVVGESFEREPRQATYRLTYRSLGFISATVVLQATLEKDALHTHSAYESINIAGIAIPTPICSDLIIVLTWILVGMVIWRIYRWIKDNYRRWAQSHDA